MQKTATIANGTSLSAKVDFGPMARLKAIIMPAGWDAAPMTFQSSEDDVTYRDMFGSAGELSIATALGRSVVLTFDQVTNFERFRYIKVRSGPTGAPVNQTAQRDLILLADER